MNKIRVVMDKKSIAECINQIAGAVENDLVKTEPLAIIGIHTRGVFIAQRVATEIKINLQLKKKGIDFDFGTLDIALYRDDVGTTPDQPEVKETKIEFDITGKTVLLVDDVLYTGRSIRAAIDQLMDFGRPQRIKLAVVIDRGLRELPIQADYVGKKITTYPTETVIVRVKEIDGKDEVVVTRKV
jgi:pyrimidine operon attenuation protein/uracil phosphoribosyltransferase